ncbi:MAG: homocysteine S-methyltransferase family protein, partial [Pseudomonadota bacterium]
YDLPEFAAFPLIGRADGNATLREYFATYAEIARRHQVGLVLESATWRASGAWADKLGYTPQALAKANHAAIALLESVRADHETLDAPMVISGCIGPRGDGYQIDTKMTVDEATRYHAIQCNTFAETSADLVTAITMTYAEEAAGLAIAAKDTGMPVVISFTTETDGRLPSGQTIEAAINEVDARTDNAPAYYMINCAHPTHFQGALEAGAAWTRRIKGIRANASTKSHTELDEATELDEGCPVELGAHFRALRSRYPHLNVLGGCCGTDHRHIQEICEACQPAVERLLCDTLH